MRKSKTSPLLALTSAALALPAFAASQPVETELSVRASSYSEGDAPEDRILVGSDERYQIDIYQFRLLTPVNRDFSLEVSASHESMSGASPWSSLKDADGDPSLVMTGATIKDNRTEIGATVTRYGDNSSFGIGISHSQEDDYEATALSLNADWDFNNKLSTLAIGLSYSSDDIKPSDAQIFDRVEQEEKHSGSFSISWTQVLNKSSVLQLALSLTKHEGFLTDPYKLRDVRPDTRFEWASSLKYRKFFDSANGAWHFNYRYYSDDYNVHSHTFETAWHQNLGPRFQVIPSVRYYAQDEAEFYIDFDNFITPLSQNQSSDFRLSTFGAVTFGLKAVIGIRNSSITFSIDRYISDERFAFSNAEFEHPALLDYTLMSVGLNLRF